MCTTVIVGKKASLNGKNIIARNEDSHETTNPKRFEFVKKALAKDGIYESYLTKVKIELPKESMSYTAMPDVVSDTFNRGRFGEASINEKNVAISSTESLYGNERVLAYDPLVKNGIAEDAINDILAPYVKTAREAVEMLGRLIEKYGSAEGNGILFADEEEIWYMEIPTGHHYVAVKLPSDMYGVAPNCVCIEKIDFNDSENYIWSNGIQEFVEKHKLNPDKDTFNFRHIFGTYSELDRVYNTSRAWYAHRYLDKNFNLGPTAKDIPFLNKADRLISVEDVQFILSSHYNETEFDPIGKGTEEQKTRFRAISLSRTQQSHVLEMDEYSIQWVAFATTAFTPYVPFFVDVNDTPVEYRDTTFELDMKYAYWLFKVFSYYVETHYGAFSKENTQYLEDLRAYGRRRVYEVKEALKDYNKQNCREFLTEQNEITAKYVLDKTRKLLNSFMTRALSASKMSFTMDENL